ncbi:hypothetical protein [Streptomyces sp. ISL-100]|uniref:hypothetical protein n=1 Tax=Streptomyces sp. ISL-100 TaxID=2819173 RepID=UPI001BEAAF61|nr:hypothetical protein [Streptomyces sp. ISL-100]MBT2401454.1 hypothetical protein [Streptomyces sp. ISL-100]
MGEEDEPGGQLPCTAACPSVRRVREGRSPSPRDGPGLFGRTYRIQSDQYRLGDPARLSAQSSGHRAVAEDAAPAGDIG